MLRKLFVILSLFFTLSHSQELKEVSLQLKWKYQFQFAGFIVAKEMGFYKDAGLDVDLREFNTDIDIVNDVKKGKVAFGVSDSSLVYHALKAEPVSAIMSIFQNSPFILMGLKSSGIQKLQDIHLKKLALHEGIDGIAIKAMLKSNNIEIKYITKSPIFNLDKLISSEIDMMTAYISNEPYVAKTKNIETITFTPKDYGFEGYGDILFTSKNMIKNSPEVVDKMYEASYKGWNYAFSHIDEAVDIIYDKYNTLGKTKEALKYEAETLKALSGYGEDFGELNIEKIKSIAQQFNLIKNENNRLDNLDNFIYQLPDKVKSFNINLTQEEKEYLNNNPVTYAGDPNWLPFEAFDTNGNYTGIIAEHIEIVENKLHKKFDKVITKDWLDTLELSKKRGVDVISGDAADLLLSQNYKAIDTYIKNPLVIVTRKEHHYIDDLNYIKDKKIAFITGAGYSADILKKYPDIKFIECDTPQSGLIGVKTGQYDAFIGTLSMSDYTIAQMGIEDIKIAGQTGIVMNLTLFVDKNRPLLHSILNKTMHSIDNIQKIKIISKWRHSIIEKVIIDYTLLWQIFGIFGIFMFIGSFYLVISKRDNKKLEELLNTTIEGIAIFQKGKLIKANKPLFAMYGYDSMDEVRGKEASCFFDETQLEFVQEQLKKEQIIYEVRMKRKDGSLFPTLVKGTNLGSDIRVSTVIDITELKDTHSKLEILNQTLESKIKEEVEKNKQQQLIMMQQARYAQMGEMISMIAHQWRQPLNNLSMIIQGSALKYKLGKFDDKIMAKLSGDSQKQIRQMSQTIDDFRYFFRPDKDAKEFSVNATISHALMLLKPVLEQESIVVETHLEENVLIKGFSNELGQVLINIINNAKDALMENNCAKKRNITVLLKKENGKALISIEDNAGGIADDVIDKIFNPYFSTKEEKNGTGLGLYMSKNIIEEHSKGILSVENSSNGAVFKIIVGGNG